MSPVTIDFWIAVLTAAAAVGVGAVRLFLWAYDKRDKRKPHRGFSAPPKTLNLVAKPWKEYWWRMGQSGDDPTMQIGGSLIVTNVSSVPVRVPRAELRFGFLGRKQISGSVMVSRSLGDGMYGAFDIPPGERRDITCEFWLYPPVRGSRETFTPHSIAFIDQFGNKHTVKRITFLPHTSSASARPAEPQELLFELR